MPSKALTLLPMDLDLHLPLALTLRQHTCQPWVGGDDRLTEPPSRRPAAAQPPPAAPLQHHVPDPLPPLSSFSEPALYGSTP